MFLAGILIIPKLNIRGTTDNPNQKSYTKNQYAIHEACDILTPELAKKIIGNDASAKARDTSSDAIVVSNCTYFSDANQLSVGLLARSARDKTGANTNQSQFASKKPIDAQNIVGYGDSAFWLARYGQLNILKGNTWYILSTGPVAVQKHTLDQTKQFADQIIDKL